MTYSPFSLSPFLVKQAILTKDLGPTLQTAHKNVTGVAQLVTKSADKAAHVTSRLEPLALKVTGIANCVVGGLCVGNAIFEKCLPEDQRIVQGVTGLFLFGVGLVFSPISVPVATLAFSTGFGYKAATTSS
ncbi:hypothetical protein OC846_005366 [Tilletia horrida]|uniref:Uncharacterized protein n=1 Tax=Tilletia horrida TaxID=155126 RepID=A0AAN6JW20_9BASI|nr:hypothetical protein OC846_005366 [Tilletia horrida]